MCNEFTMLVEQSDWRYLAQCEHATVHLRWDHLTISLPPLAFRKLAQQILQEGAQVMRAYAQPSDVTTSVAAKRQASLRLRLNTVLLEFPATDLPLLLDLLRQATTLLDQADCAATRPAPTTRIVIKPYPTRGVFALAQNLN